MLRPLLLLGLASCGAPSAEPGRPYGVQIFAEDTVVAHVSVTVTGDARLTLRGDNFRTFPDRSFSVSTPATLVITQGVGTATITSLDSTKRLAVIPIGTPEDSLDAATVAGSVVRLTRLGYEGGKLRLSVARP